MINDQAHVEWYAWGAICVQLKKRGIDINAPEANALALSIKRWGVEFASMDKVTIDHAARATAHSPLAHQDNYTWELDLE